MSIKHSGSGGGCGEGSGNDTSAQIAEVVGRGGPGDGAARTRKPARDREVPWQFGGGGGLRDVGGGDGCAIVDSDGDRHCPERWLRG